MSTSAPPTKPLGHKGYGSIPHLPGSRLGPGDHHCHAGQEAICWTKTRDRHDEIIVTEKLDGSNVSIAKLNGSILAIGRAGYLAQPSGAIRPGARSTRRPLRTGGASRRRGGMRQTPEGTPTMTDDQDTRRYALELALKIAPTDPVPEAERILEFLVPKASKRSSEPTAAVSKKRAKGGYILGATPSEEQSALILSLYPTATPMPEIRDRANALPGPHLGTQNIGCWAANRGLRRPDSCIAPNVKTMLAARKRAANGADHSVAP